MPWGLQSPLGFSDFDINVRQLTLNLDTLDSLIQTGWEMCELSKLPLSTQSKIRKTTIEKAAAYKSDEGYEFPDRIVVGVATK